MIILCLENILTSTLTMLKSDISQNCTKKSFQFQRSYSTVTSTEHCTKQRRSNFYFKIIFNFNYFTERNVNALPSGDKLTLRYRPEGRTIMWGKNCPICPYHLLISLHLHWKHLAQNQEDRLRTTSDSRAKNIFKLL